MATLLFFDEGRFNHLCDQLKQSCATLQPLVALVTRLDVQVRIETNAELLQLVEGGSEYIRKRIAAAIPSGSLTLGPFVLSRKKLTNALEIPDLSAIDNLAAEAKEHRSSVQHITIKNDKLTFDIEALKSECSLYAKTKEEEELYRLHEKLAETFEKFNSVYADVFGYHVDKGTPLATLFKFDQHTSVTKRIVQGVSRTFTDKDGKNHVNQITPDYTSEMVSKGPVTIMKNERIYLNQRLK